MDEQIRHRAEVRGIDRTSGPPIWKAYDPACGWTSPLVFELGDAQQLVAEHNANPPEQGPTAGGIVLNLTQRAHRPAADAEHPTQRATRATLPDDFERGNNPTDRIHP